MERRSLWDLARLSAADKILAVGAALLFVYSFQPWQVSCVRVSSHHTACSSASAWGGSAAFAGVIMALLSVLLVIGAGLSALGVVPPSRFPMHIVIGAVAGGTFVFGLIKFAFVAGHDPDLAVWLALPLVLLIGYGGWRKVNESKRK